MKRVAYRALAGDGFYPAHVRFDRGDGSLDLGVECHGDILELTAIHYSETPNRGEAGPASLLD